MEEHPVLSAATLVGIGGGVLAVLVALGIPISTDLKFAVLGLLATLAPFIVAWLQRGKTTALVNPKDEQGRELVVKDTGAPPLQAARYRARKHTAA